MIFQRAETTNQHRAAIWFVSTVYRLYTWRFPEIGVAPVLISSHAFRWICHYKPSSYWGTSIYGNPHILKATHRPLGLRVLSSRSVPAPEHRQIALQRDGIFEIPEAMVISPRKHGNIMVLISELN